MKTNLVLVMAVLQIGIQNTYSQNIGFDKNIEKCIPVPERDNATLQEYTKIQIITGFISRPISDIASRNLLPEDNAYYNQFLTCSWKEYGFQTKHGDVVYPAIERALREAFIREVGTTGPAMNLSTVEAKRITDNCKSINGLTGGSRAVQVQNCILKQIQYLKDY